MTTQADTDSYIDLRSIQAFYMGDTNGAANWILKFQTTMNEEEAWTNVYYGIWTDEIPDLNTLLLPTGTFTAGTDCSAGTFEPEYTFQRLYPEEIVTTFTGGTIEITKEGTDYTIQSNLTDGTNNVYRYRYTGKVVGEDQSPHHLPLVTSDVNAPCYLAEGTYFGDYYKTGTSVINLQLTADGVVFCTELFAPGAESFSPDVLRPGTYTVKGDRSEWTLTPGEEFNYAGWEYRPQGTYCRVIGQTDTYGFATSGTIEVEQSGNQYTLTFNLTTNNGKTVTGSFTGPLTLRDGTEQPVISQLEEDRVLDLSHIPEGKMLYSGEWYHNGMNNWTIYVKDESIDNIDGMIFDFNMPDMGFLPEGIPTGTYELSSVAKENTLVPGFINTYLAGTWYIWANAGGSYRKAAPIKTGSLTIGKEGDIWTLDFEMYDDARPPHKISGSWSGPIQVVNEWD